MGVTKKKTKLNQLCVEAASEPDLAPEIVPPHRGEAKNRDAST